MRVRMAVLAAVIFIVVPASAAASVIYVGDSLGVGTSPHLREELGGVGLEVDAKVGRPSSVGVDVLQSRISADHDVVVFDLGTNDDPAAPEALAANLAQARQIAGDRCLVIATLNRPPLNGVSIDGLNQAITGFAGGDPATQLVDWHAQAVRDPGLLSDGIHAGPEGYALRAQLFADAIAGCAAGSAGETAGSTGGGLGRESAHAPPLPEPEPERAPRLPLPRDDDPVIAVAAELARAIEVGAEFG
jgi:hypothetical protein